MKKYIYFAMAMLMAGSFVSCTEEGPEDEGNVIIVGQNIETPTTWLGSKTYVVERAIYVDANLTIEPGTVIKFKSGSSLSFGSYENMTLTANGTEDKPIVFTSFSANPAPVPGKVYGFMTMLCPILPWPTARLCMPDRMIILL